MKNLIDNRDESLTSTWARHERKLEAFVGDEGVKIFPYLSVNAVAILFIGEILKHIMIETNSYYRQMCRTYKSMKKSKKWNDITIPEFKKISSFKSYNGINT